MQQDPQLLKASTARRSWGEAKTDTFPHPAFKWPNLFFHTHSRAGITPVARNKQTSGTKCKWSTSALLVPRQFSPGCCHWWSGHCCFHIHAQHGWQSSTTHRHRWVEGSPSNRSQKKQELLKEGLFSSASKAWEDTIDAFRPNALSILDKPMKGTLFHQGNVKGRLPSEVNYCAAQGFRVPNHQPRVSAAPFSHCSRSSQSDWEALVTFRMAVGEPRLTSDLQKCNTIVKILLKQEPKWRTLLSLYPPPPWRDMHPPCHAKEMICKSVSEAQCIGGRSCQFQGKPNKVRSHPGTNREMKSYIQRIGKGKLHGLGFMKKIAYLEKTRL